MKTMHFFSIIVVLLATAVLAEACENKLAVSNKDFLSACNAGFKASFDRNKTAAKLGEGQAFFTVIGDDKVKEAELTWFAWVDGTGKVNLAVNSGEYDLNHCPLWAVTGSDANSDYDWSKDWTSWKIFHISSGGQTWLEQGHACFTWATFGMAGPDPAKRFVECREILKTIGFMR